jgi:hypothetical protein
MSSGSPKNAFCETDLAQLSGSLQRFAPLSKRRAARLTKPPKNTCADAFSCWRQMVCMNLSICARICCAAFLRRDDPPLDLSQSVSVFWIGESHLGLVIVLPTAA